ncbi:MAG: 2-hydroxyacyl-CoA dehydratase, partial [Candidatus Cloacimonetes bacterium]|nr:2-hydroxyacyl-CoA dehydratase [Candidatus Cloacimonadota bacterium]
AQFESELVQFLAEAEQRKPFCYQTRLAYLGVPPIYTNLYEFLNQFEGDVVFNEVQRQFSMPPKSRDIIEQYLSYTYPYRISQRLDDILSQLEQRQIHGVISYTQAFCHRQIDNTLLRKFIDLPFLVLEGDRPGPIDSRTALRLESFLDMLC